MSEIVRNFVSKAKRAAAPAFAAVAFGFGGSPADAKPFSPPKFDSPSTIWEYSGPEPTLEDVVTFPPLQQTEIPQPPLPTTGQPSRSNANVRPAPSTDGTPLGTAGELGIGQNTPVYGKYTDASGSTWYITRTPGGQTAFLSEQVFTVSGEPPDLTNTYNRIQAMEVLDQNGRVTREPTAVSNAKDYLKLESVDAIFSHLDQQYPGTPEYLAILGSKNTEYIFQLREDVTHPETDELYPEGSVFHISLTEDGLITRFTFLPYDEVTEALIQLGAPLEIQFQSTNNPDILQINDRTEFNLEFYKETGNIQQSITASPEATPSPPPDISMWITEGMPISPGFDIASLYNEEIARTLMDSETIQLQNGSEIFSGYLGTFVFQDNRYHVFSGKWIGKYTYVNPSTNRSSDYVSFGIRRNDGGVNILTSRNDVGNDNDLSDLTMTVKDPDKLSDLSTSSLRVPPFTIFEDITQQTPEDQALQFRNEVELGTVGLIAVKIDGSPSNNQIFLALKNGDILPNINNDNQTITLIPAVIAIISDKTNEE